MHEERTATLRLQLQLLKLRLANGNCRTCTSFEGGDWGEKRLHAERGCQFLRVPAVAVNKFAGGVSAKLFTTKLYFVVCCLANGPKLVRHSVRPFIRSSRQHGQTLVVDCISSNHFVSFFLVASLLVSFLFSRFVSCSSSDKPDRTNVRCKSYGSSI